MDMVFGLISVNGGQRETMQSVVFVEQITACLTGTERGLFESTVILKKSSGFGKKPQRKAWIGVLRWQGSRYFPVSP